MNNQPHCFTSGPLSSKLDLLTPIIGEQIVEIIRYSWLAPQAATSQYGLSPGDCFSLTAGPLTIRFGNNLIIGFASDPSLASVICWTERDTNGTWRNERLDQDTELFPISATDNLYSAPKIKSVVGEILTSFTIWKRPSVNHQWDELPREVAIRFVTTNGHDLWLTHGLHDDSDDFSVLEESRLMEKLRICLIEPRTVGAVQA